jgi:hypothetical protein
MSNLQHRTMDHHVRDYAEFMLSLIAAFGTLALLQSALFFVKTGWSATASKAIAVFVLRITGFWLLMAIVTGTIGSLVPATGNLCLLLDSLMHLAMKARSVSPNATDSASDSGA